MFITDKQTTDELNLLGRYQTDSVFALFNKTKTRGGEQLLEQLLRNPLTDATAINRRSAVFQYFQHHAFDFPLDGEQVARFAAWLDAGGSRTSVGSILAAWKKKTLASLLHDEQYAQLSEGLAAAAKVLHLLFTFLSDGVLAGVPAPFGEETKNVKAILSDKRIGGLRLLAAAASLSVKDIAFYDRLLKHTMADEMQQVLQFIYGLDAHIAVGAAAMQKNLAYAEAKDATGNELYVKGLRHPALDKAVGNDIRLDTKHNLLFLTGANMAGKSTLMKSVGIALYLAHCGFPVAAKEMGFTVKEGLFSSINVPDNINLGYSHFYAEVLRVKQAAQQVSQKKSLLVMFDELFKGTNVKDAYEGTLEVTKAFSKYGNCLFIISTHIIEVGEDLSGEPNILFGYMPTVMHGNTPRYTYALTEGITEDRQGMLIIQNEGILELLEE